MKNIIILLLMAIIAWQFYLKPKYQTTVLTNENSITANSKPSPQIQALTNPNHYRCDGRVHCSQMNSCAEATYFLQHCPGTKMDGNHDGIPCERQWCD